jgi:thiamine biosynthesis lipoprotein
MLHRVPTFTPAILSFAIVVWLSIAPTLSMTEASNKTDLGLHQIEGSAFGTTYSLRYVDTNPPPSLEAIASLMAKELERLDGIFSLYRADSEIIRINRSPANQWIQVSSDLIEVLAFAKELSNLTRGAFDPTILPVVQTWNFRPDPNWAPPNEELISSAMRKVSHHSIEIDRRTQSIRKLHSDVSLDLNALVEGWAMACLLRQLEAEGVSNFLFTLGGEIYAGGEGPESDGWRVGIENPMQPNQIHSKLNLKNQALCTSGTYRQYWTHAGQSYSHILDARTGRPVRHALCSVSIVHPDAFIADGWATALLILGPEVGKQLADEHHLDARFIVRNETNHMNDNRFWRYVALGSVVASLSLIVLLRQHFQHR